jgi:apolipoprotein N-acyltransferase
MCDEGNEAVPVRDQKSQIPDLKSSLAACALSGFLLVLCFPKAHLPGLVWVACLPMLAVLARENRLKHAFLQGYLCGAIFFLGSCYWFVTVVTVYGGLSPALAVVVLILFIIVDSTFFGVFGLVMGWVARRSALWALAAAPFLWVAMEVARTYLITGFPWNLLGYAVQAAGLRQIASVTGVYGLSFLAVATGAMGAWLILKFRCKWAWLGLGGWVLLLLLAQWRLAPPLEPEGRELAFLVQPNVPLDGPALDAWIPWRDPTELQRLVSISVTTVDRFMNRPSSEPPAGAHLASGPPLLVWAENPAPFYFTRDPVFRNAMQNMARETHTIVILNTIVPMDAEGKSITNSAIVLDPDGREVSRYDKIHLVPFGEYVPAWALPGLVSKITSEVGNFVPGSRYSVARTPAGGIGVFICYEAIIPQLARELTKSGAGVLVNISNDAWYGESAAARQHLEMARLRAIENHRYLLRATNNGLTTEIDPYGRLLGELPRYRRMIMPVYFNYETRQTFYSAHGDIFSWLCVVIAALMLARATLGLKRKG